MNVLGSDQNYATDESVPPMWDAFLASLTPSPQRAPMKIIRQVRVYTADHQPCMLYLTKDELSWDVGLKLPRKLVNRIHLGEIVYVNKLTRCREVYDAGLAKKLSSPAWERISPSLDPFGFVVGTVDRLDQHHWTICELVFLCDNERDVFEWIDDIDPLLRLVPTRPWNLLVFVNPNSGHKRAEHIHSKLVKPLFELANISTEVVVTTHRGHATEYLLKQSELEKFDGVICVGGDGFFAEIVQGMLLRERIKADLPLYEGHFPGDIELPCPIHIGIVAAGSTDTVAFSTHGTNDPLTSLLHIILGDSLSIDVAAIHSGDNGRFIRYAASMTAYGFHADLLRNDDKIRWLGPKRYDYSGIATFLKHNVYSGEISYLPSSNRRSFSTDGVFCSSGCRICASDVSVPNLIPNGVDAGTQTTSVANEIGSSTTFYIGNSDGEEKNGVEMASNGEFPSENGHSSDPQSGPDLFPSPSIYAQFKQFTDPSRPLVSSPSWARQGCPGGWRTVTGTFVAINAFLQSCRCLKAKSGPAPWAHLGDGCLDLILVRNCSRRRFLKFLFRTAHNRSPFTLPFVTVVRACAFTFRATVCSAPASLDGYSKPSVDSLTADLTDLPTSPLKNSPCTNCITSQNKESSWCADGELIPQVNLSVFVHRKLIRLYARGPERP